LVLFGGLTEVVECELEQTVLAIVGLRRTARIFDAGRVVAAHL